MPSLTLVTFLPLVGAIVIAFLPRERAAAGSAGPRSARRWRRGSSRSCSWPASTATQAGFQFVESGGLGPGLRHPVQARRRRHLARARRADDDPDLDQHPGQLRADQGAGEGVHDLLPRARGRHDRRLPGARHVPLLHLLGDRPDPDVPDHRHLGRRQPHLRDDQVRPLHARRIAADAGRDPGDRLHLPGADRRPGPARSTTERCAGSASIRRSSSSPSPASSWRSRSRCRCSRSTPGCPMPTSRRRPPAR